MVRAVLSADKARVVNKLGAFEDLSAELCKVAVGVRGNDKVLVIRSLEHAVGCGACGVVALPVRVLAVGRLLKEGVHGGEALLHRDVYHLPLAGSESVEQSYHACAEGVLAAYEVGDYNTGLHRGAIALAGHIHDAAARLSEDIEAGVLRLGAGLAESGNGAVDYVGLYGLERFIVKPHLFHGAGLHRLKNYVAGLAEFEYRSRAVGVL